MDFAEHFKAVNIGEPAAAGGLRVFPLYPVRPAAVSVELLADAVARDAATVEEDRNAEGAWYRKVVVDNRGKVAVLVRDGDLLLGGMQDRTAERSCIVPAQARVVVPALCVEQRRSHYAGRATSASRGPRRTRSCARRASPRRSAASHCRS